MFLCLGVSGSGDTIGGLSDAVNPIMRTAFNYRITGSRVAKGDGLLDNGDMNRPMRRLTVDDIVDTAGGPQALAHRLGCGRTTIFDWKRSGRLPGTRLAQICAAMDLQPGDVIHLAAGPRRRVDA